MMYVQEICVSVCVCVCEMCVCKVVSILGHC